jgi:hypothetical protein
MSDKKEKKLHKSTTGGIGFKPTDQSNWRRKLDQKRLKFDDFAKEIFLNHFKENNLVLKACDAADIAYSTLYLHLENDPDFREAYEQAQIEYKERVVSHVQNLAFNGISNPIFAGKDGEYRGEKVEYPIQLIMMEAKKVEHAYRDRHEVDIKSSSLALSNIVFTKSCCQSNYWDIFIFFTFFNFF